MGDRPRSGTAGTQGDPRTPLCQAPVGGVGLVVEMRRAAESDVDLSFRSPRIEDGSHLWTLAGSVGLDENSPYAYLLWSEYFASTSIVAEADDEVVGFVTGFCPPERPDRLFVWQVGVDDGHRGHGIAGRMIGALIERTGVTGLEATVTPSNSASEALFRGIARRHGAEVHTSVLFERDHFPPGHEAEVRFVIEPLSSPT